MIESLLNLDAINCPKEALRQLESVTLPIYVLFDSKAIRIEYLHELVSLRGALHFAALAKPAKSLQRLAEEEALRLCGWKLGMLDHEGYRTVCVDDEFTSGYSFDSEDFALMYDLDEFSDVNIPDLSDESTAVLVAHYCKNRERGGALDLYLKETWGL